MQPKNPKMNKNIAIIALLFYPGRARPIYASMRPLYTSTRP